MIINIKPYKKKIFNKSEFSYSLKNESEILSLPIHPYLTKKEIKYISDNLNLFAKINK